MNQKLARKVRQDTTRYWRKYFAEIHKLPFWERLKIALAVIFAKE